MLYLVYSVLSVCCTRCKHRIMQLSDWEDDLTLYSVMVVQFKTRKIEGGWRREQSGAYEQIWEIRGMTCPSGYTRLHIDILNVQIGCGTFLIGNGQLTRTWNSLLSQYLMIIYHLSTHLYLSRPQLYHHLGTWSQHIPLYLYMPWSWVNNEYRCGGNPGSRDRALQLP